MFRAGALISSTLPLLRQLGLCQPEIVDTPHHGLEIVQLYRLAQVAVRMELITSHNIRFCLRSREDERWD
jgi:hypothetical protein